MIPLIEALSLSHKFEVLLYEGVNLKVCEGESVAIVGVSGSGKSTLINNLSTLLPPLSGKVSLCGINDIYARSENERLNLRKNDVGIVFQSHYLFRGFNAMENLQVSSILTGQKIDFELLELFGISGILKQQIGELSGGQQQRLSIARVLLKKPRVIFADEPTGNLDKDTTNSVMSVIFDYIKRYNAALLIATHDNEVANLCTRKFSLKDKKLLDSTLDSTNFAKQSSVKSADSTLDSTKKRA